MSGCATGSDTVFGSIWRSHTGNENNLIQLDIENGQAYAWSRTRLAGWAAAEALFRDYYKLI